jgi:hypothetical protein
MTEIKRVLLPDVDAYDGPLWQGAAAVIARLEAGYLTPDQYQRLSRNGDGMIL